MAKIALITPQLSSSVQTLANSLHQQQFQVSVITGRDSQELLNDVPYPVLTPFKRWLPQEALMSFAHQLPHPPDVWHFIFPEVSRRTLLNPGILTLATLAKSLPNRVVAASLFEKPNLPAHWLSRNVFRLFDLVTVNTRENLMYLKREKCLQHFCMSEVLPPLFSGVNVQTIASGEDVDLTQNLTPYVVVPSTPSLDAKHILESLPSGFRLLIFGERPKAPFIPGIHYIEPSTTQPEIEAHYIAKSAGLILYFENYNVLELQKYFSIASRHKIPLFVHPMQIESFPGLVHHKRTGWILDCGLTSLKMLTSENPHMRFPFDRDPEHRFDLTDYTVNEMSRLYHRSLQQKASHRFSKTQNKNRTA